MNEILMAQAQEITGRFAPSPTGPLHFGSLVAAVGSYCLARQAGGRWLLRIDDLDAPRVMPGAADEILRTLENLGFTWDGEIIWQSRRADRYRAALEHLHRQGMIFPCACSRREILASAPHFGDEGPVYPGTCRSGLPPGRQPRAQRLRVPELTVCFIDGVFGHQSQPLGAVGDFILHRADGMFAYQLATVVDDADSGVNQVVRGEDLLASTPRQIFLHSCLQTPIPYYIHLPLALTPEGEKISKRHSASAADVPDLWRALRFLGQPIPEMLRPASGKEILAWGSANFTLARVPKSHFSSPPGKVA